MEPKEITILYYKLLYSGDLVGIKRLMTQTSYFMTLESFGLGLSFSDPYFKVLLKEIKENESSLKKVEELLSTDLVARTNNAKIKILNAEMNGEKRQTVNYTEADKMKELFFSKEKDGWKINYYAGRKVD